MLEQSESSGVVCERLTICKRCARGFSGRNTMLERLIPELRAFIMKGECRMHGLQPIGVELGENLSHEPMELSTTAHEQRAVGGFLNKHMLESIFPLWG